LIYSSGQLPTADGRLLATGKVGAEVSVEYAVRCARTAALNGLAAVAEVAGGLDAIQQVVKVVIFVASPPEFTSLPQVGNGASQLLAEIFGESGRHARSAVGVASLPLDAPVEIELIVRARAVPTVHPVAI
jgi:enamine deaminase RidA (YjgF/YER057c/UK114 family)